MQTVMALIALAGSVASANIPAKPQWQSDYRQAGIMAADARKPLAVFVGHGVSGWEKVSKDGNFDPKVNELLNDKYVCLYIDTNTASGRKLATDFDVAGKGLIISDKTGNTQAFYHSGDLSKDVLAKALERYAEPTRVAQSTETVAQLTPPRRVVQPESFCPT
jgi:hypothetical protein